MANTADDMIHNINMGCSVHRNRHGKLTFRIYHRGREFWEGIGADATAANTEIATAQAVLISEEIRRDSFDYLRWFPGGNKAHLFQRRQADATVQQHYEKWIPLQKPPMVRKSCERDYRQHFTAYILGRIGSLRLANIHTDTLEVFRSHLLEDRGIKIKTARNVIDGSLRAFWRHARRVEKIVDHDPFADLEWPDADELQPDPMTEAERDKIIDWFQRNCRHYYPWVFTQFWTGMRPSEAAGLRMTDVDLRTGKIAIQRSRSLGEDNRTKTKKSKRTITLLPNVLEVWNQIARIHRTDSDAFFINTEGRPLVPDNFRKEYWYRALTACGIRLRKPYCSRHTFISVMLLHGENMKRVADYCGTSPTMIDKHYARFLEDDASFGHRAMTATRPGNGKAKPAAGGKH